MKLLYNNINKNVDLIIKKGLFKEALKLYKKYYKFNLNSLNTIGYKEIFEYLKIKKKNKKIKFINYINKIKKNTRNYAKRQITWYRKKTDIYWFKPNDYKKIIYLINKKINE
ncbi:MAG: hypothetical protein NHG13_00350 [Candidatus Shikimatogenerans bostrichidophilus]|nr:MAG: hypothetical protein NHG13_00350 [Candidatus Shikimatogenerans bostrichidophilus]